MTTKRIDSQTELAKFLYEIELAGIEIPSNVSIEIDSPTLEKDIVGSFLCAMELSGAPFAERIGLKNFIYMGKRITFKHELNKSI